MEAALSPLNGFLEKIYNKRNWFVLFTLVIGLLGGYSFYDAPGALAVWLEQDLNIAPTRLGLLYSAYSAPIVIFALFCGNLADTFGPHIFMAIYQIMTVLGSALFALAYSQTEQVAFIMMLMSRFIAGIGTEGLTIVSRKVVFAWFDETGISLAITLMMTLPFLGTQYAFIFLPILATNFGAETAFWSVFLICLISGVFTVIYFIIARLCPTQWEETDIEDDTNAKNNMSWFRRFISTVKSLPWRFWVLCLSNMFIQGALWPFVAFSPDFFYHHYSFSPEVAGIFATMLAGMAIPLGVVVGSIGQKVPKPVVGMIASLLQIICFLALGWATELPCIIATLGLSIVLGSVGTCAIAPVSQMVPRENIGMALGIMKSGESFSWLISSPVYGAIYEATHNFGWSCTFFACMGIVAFPLQLILFITRHSEPKKAGDAPVDMHV